MSTAGKTHTIRTATKDDLPTIVGIYNWAVNQTFATIDSEPLSKEEAESWWEMHAGRNFVLVAEAEGDVIGWARLLPWKQRGFDVVEDLVYVDPLAHGKGVGADLLKNLIEEARGLRNCKTIVATMATDNLPSLKLHKRLGFEEAGIIPNAAYKFTRWMDIALLQRSLEH